MDERVAARFGDARAQPPRSQRRRKTPVVNDKGVNDKGDPPEKPEVPKKKNHHPHNPNGKKKKKGRRDVGVVTPPESSESTQDRRHRGHDRDDLDDDVRKKLSSPRAQQKHKRRVRPQPHDDKPKRKDPPPPPKEDEEKLSSNESTTPPSPRAFAVDADGSTETVSPRRRKPNVEENSSIESSDGDSSDDALAVVSLPTPVSMSPLMKPPFTTKPPPRSDDGPSHGNNNFPMLPHPAFPFNTLPAGAAPLHHMEYHQALRNSQENLVRLMMQSQQQQPPPPPHDFDCRSRSMDSSFPNNPFGGGPQGHHHHEPSPSPPISSSSCRSQSYVSVSGISSSTHPPPIETHCVQGPEDVSVTFSSTSFPYDDEDDDLQRHLEHVYARTDFLLRQHAAQATGEPFPAPPVASFPVTPTMRDRNVVVVPGGFVATTYTAKTIQDRLTNGAQFPRSRSAPLSTNPQGPRLSPRGPPQGFHLPRKSSNDSLNGQNFHHHHHHGNSNGNKHTHHHHHHHHHQSQQQKHHFHPGGGVLPPQQPSERSHRWGNSYGGPKY